MLVGSGWSSDCVADAGESGGVLEVAECDLAEVRERVESDLSEREMDGLDTGDKDEASKLLVALLAGGDDGACESAGA